MATTRLFKMSLDLVENAFADDPVRHRDIHKELQGRVLVSRIQEAIGKNVDAAAQALVAKGIAVEKHQIHAYFDSRHTPQAKIVRPIARAFKMPDLICLNDYPWRLFSGAALNFAEIEGICATAGLKNDLSALNLRRGQSRWHRPQDFEKPSFRIEPPGEPEDFWQSIASYRAAEATRDFESMNFHRWAAVTKIGSLAKIPAVASNFQVLCRCMDRLTWRVKNPRMIWFSVRWYQVAKILENKSEDHKSAFDDVYLGAKIRTNRHLGMRPKRQTVPKEWDYLSGLFGR